jgi:hypothetical protein
MRKLIWCGSIAGVVAASGFLSLCYYACRHPDSIVGRGMCAIADASISMQPLSGLASLVVKPNPAHETNGSAEECVPDDPQPVAVEKVEMRLEATIERNFEVEEEIVIPEAEVPNKAKIAQVVDAMIDDNLRELPAANGQVIMPPCRDGDAEPMPPPRMPLADEVVEKPTEAKKPTEAPEKSEDGVFAAWKKLFETGEEKPNTAETLPYPTEEESEPKCEEDSHRHEQYPGCPRVTCPYTGKSYPTNPAKSAGKEESSEEPKERPHHKPHSYKIDKDKDDFPHPMGVDTMEFRKSDAGLNEYGPGPIH